MFTFDLSDLKYTCIVDDLCTDLVNAVRLNVSSLVGIYDCIITYLFICYEQCL